MPFAETVRARGASPSWFTVRHGLRHGAASAITLAAYLTGFRARWCRARRDRVRPPGTRPCHAGRDQRPGPSGHHRHHPPERPGVRRGEPRDRTRASPHRSARRSGPSRRLSDEACAARAAVGGCGDAHPDRLRRRLPRNARDSRSAADRRPLGAAPAECRASLRHRPERSRRVLACRLRGWALAGDRASRHGGRAGGRPRHRAFAGGRTPSGGHHRDAGQRRADGVVPSSSSLSSWSRCWGRGR